MRPDLHPDSRPAPPRGFALLLSLLMILLLTVLILELDFQTRADLRAAAHFQEDLKAYHLARSAISAGEALLKYDTQGGSKYDALTELWASPIAEYPLGDGVISGAITDEAGKFNLNSLVKDGVEVPKKSAQFKRLLARLGMDAEQTTLLLDSILDWLDRDTLPRPAGAEEETYARLSPSYAPPDAPLSTLDELHMIQGMRDDLYRKLLPYVTIYGNSLGDQAGSATGKVNVNTAEDVVLESLGFDAETARRLMDERPFEKMSDYLSRYPVSRYPAGNDVEIKSDTFSIRAEGRVNETRKVIHAVVRRGTTPKRLYLRVE
jgi:general secretion pathway protein K